ncbi:MAG: formylglycine-generating enzyme family protein, partial [Chloroflexi bacterium]|nr:formylglycine-generating enzyme family protein [Chloroflexota bacterium]
QNEHLVLAGECAVDAGKRLPPPMQNKVLTRLHAQMTNSNLAAKERFAAAYQWDALGGPPEDVNRWLKCPACGDGKEDLLVGKYPVTNAQFALFIAAGGYEKAEFWDGEESVDWQWRIESHPDYRGEGPVEMPEFWRDTQFGRERRGFPVVGVSWYEVQAYCRWLTHLLERLLDGDEAVTAAERALVADLAAAGTRKVRLLRETEWERAAGGKQNNRYPWDKGLEVTDTENRAIITARANVNESEINQTTPIAMYPDGESPFGLQDLAGNVWEWTESFFDDDKKSYTVRGGSWGSSQWGARVASRLRDPPHNSNYGFGFRAVSPVVLSPDS